MSDTALATRAEARDLEAELNSIATGIERPRTYAYQPPDGEPRTNIVNDPHRVPIQDMHARALDMQAEKALLLKCFGRARMCARARASNCARSFSNRPDDITPS